MSGWPMIALLALAAAAFLWRFARPSRGVAVGVAAALAPVVAGYANQGKPAPPGHPTPVRDVTSKVDTSVARSRGALLEHLSDYIVRAELGAGLDGRRLT